MPLISIFWLWKIYQIKINKHFGWEVHCKQLCIWFIILSGSVQLTWSSSSWNWTGKNLWSEVCRPWIWNFPKQFQFNISEIRQSAHPVPRLHQTFETYQSTLKKQFEDNADFLVRAFKADHNVLTELPYDFSQLLQNFDTKNVTLGYNQWMCSCHAEITSVVRRFSFLYSSCPMSIPILNYADRLSVLLLPTH